MKRITIQTITLRNWRGERERTTTFHTDAPTYICGDNGLGKSRHFDAFCWLLFGKDSQDRTNYELRTYDKDHRPLHHCECSVEAQLLIDGEPLTIKREWHENWTKPRGQTEERLKNNETLCEWNGAPISKTEYDKRVSEEIVGDTLFKMLTNPRYFAEQMKWQQQREVLLTMAGEKSDAELAADNADFKALLVKLSGKSLADFRREMATTKKRLKEEADKVPTRIDEVQRNMPVAEDWDALAADLAMKHSELQAIDHQLQDSDARDEAERKALHDLRSELYIHQASQASVLRKAKADAEREADALNAARREIEKSLKEAHMRLADANIDDKRNKGRMSDLVRAIAERDKELEALRKEWYDINAKVYDETAAVCPLCHQHFPEVAVKEAREKFAQAQADLLANNTVKGKAVAAAKAQLQKELDELREAEASLNGQIEKATADVQTLSAAFAETPVVAPIPVKAEELEAWQEEQAKIAELERQIAEASAPKEVEDTSRFNERKATVQAAIATLNIRLSKRGELEKCAARIKELEQRGRDLAQQIADVERREYVAAQFSRRKIEDCEGRINGMFNHVCFKLFDYTLEGGEFETCVQLVDGVPYAVANTASQLNAGLDIIATLCRFNNISAPIFIDGAESVNHYAETPSQIILLQVTEDKEIIVK